MISQMHSQTEILLSFIAAGAHRNDDVRTGSDRGNCVKFLSKSNFVKIYLLCSQTTITVFEINETGMFPFSAERPDMGLTYCF